MHGSGPEVPGEPGDWVGAPLLQRANSARGASKEAGCRCELRYSSRDPIEALGCPEEQGLDSGMAV